MKDIYIADFLRLDENKPFDSIYLVLSKQHRTTRNAKPYISLILGDNSGQIDLLKKLGPTEFDRSDLLPATTCDIAELWARLEAAVASFTDSDLQRLVTTILADPATREAFIEAPAAKQLHHAYLGGLLEHVVSLIGLADRVVPHYPMLMRDLVVTGVILHDIGKIRELAWETGFEYTLEGTLLGHIQIGAAMIEKTIDTLPDFPPRLKTLVLHMILSHHGKLEFGSPKLPMIPEALMLNFLDDMDAKMQTLASEFQKAARQGKSPDEMTDRIWALDQRTMLNSRAWLGEDKAPNGTTVKAMQEADQGESKKLKTSDTLFENLGI
jgi:3'-5' exoribonuclease